MHDYIDEYFLGHIKIPGAELFCLFIERLYPIIFQILVLPYIGFYRQCKAVRNGYL